jgi:hypothetical protein
LQVASHCAERQRCPELLRTLCDVHQRTQEATSLRTTKTKKPTRMAGEGYRGLPSSIRNEVPSRISKTNGARCLPSASYAPSDRCSPSSFHNSEQHSQSQSPLPLPSPSRPALPRLTWEKRNGKSTYVTLPPPPSVDANRRSYSLTPSRILEARLFASCDALPGTPTATVRTLPPDLVAGPM